jgi:hypothetical protein
VILKNLRQLVPLRPCRALARLAQPRPHLHDKGRTDRQPLGDLAHRLALGCQHPLL